MIKKILIFGGIINLVSAICHIGFWKIFNWHDDLFSLSILNQGIMQILNICLIYIFLFFTFISFYLANNYKMEFMEKMMIALIAGLWLLRAILEFPYFGFTMQGLGIILFCIFISGCYASILPKKQI